MLKATANAFRHGSPWHQMGLKALRGMAPGGAGVVYAGHRAAEWDDVMGRR